MLNHPDEHQNSDEIKFQINLGKDDGNFNTLGKSNKSDVTKTSNVPGRLVALSIDSVLGS